MKRLPTVGLLLILVVAPFFYTTALRDVFTLPKALPLSLGVALLWLSLTLRGTVTFDRQLTPAIKAMLGAAVLCALFSVDTPLSIIGPHQQQFYALVPLALYALIFYASANSNVDKDDMALMAVLGGVAVSIPALTQIGSHSHRFAAWSIQGGRAGSTFGAPIFLGAYLAMLLPLAWAMSEPLKAAVLVGPIAAALLASGSRGSLAAGAAGVLLVEYLRNRSIGKWLGIIVPALFLVCLFRYATAHESDTGRFEVWRIAIQAWRAHPLLGWGPDTFPLAFGQFMTPRFVEANGKDIFVQLSAHNDVLQVLATMGLVGLAAYAYLSMEATRLLRDYAPEAHGVAGAVLAVFINAKFNPIPMAVLAILACLVGALDRPWPIWRSESDHPRLAAGLAAAASMLLVLVFGFMCKAEYHQRRGEMYAHEFGQGVRAAEQFNIAAQVNPFDIYYTQRQLDYFWTVIPHQPGINKTELAAFSHRVAENAWRLHPNDPVAHEIRSISYKFEGDMLGHDRLWEAVHEMEVAIRLRPNFSQYVLRRDELLRLMR